MNSSGTIASTVKMPTSNDCSENWEKAQPYEGPQADHLHSCLAAASVLHCSAFPGLLAMVLGFCRDMDLAAVSW